MKKAYAEVLFDNPIAQIINVRKYLGFYKKNRAPYRIGNIYRFPMVPNAQYSEIIQSFNELIYKLNPDKYHNIYKMFEPINIIQFCYYVSNMLVCISHDIVYAINKEIDKLTNYNNNENKKSEISLNIENIIKQSFNDIINALTGFKSGMFFTELLYVDKQISMEYNRSFKKIPKLICAFEKKI